MAQKVSKESCLQWLYRAWGETQNSIDEKHPHGKIVPTKWTEIPAYSTIPVVAFNLGFTAKANGIRSPYWADMAVFPDMEMAKTLFEAYVIYQRASSDRSKEAAKKVKESAHQSALNQSALELVDPIDDPEITEDREVPAFLKINNRDPIMERLARIEVSLQEQHSELAALNQGVNELLKEWSEDA